MKCILKKKPKGATIIQGFPSIGLVSTIATKFLIDHLNVEQIGHFESQHLMPLTAIHKSKVVEPISIYHNKKYNIIIIQSLADVKGIEWDLANCILKMAKDLQAKEVITIEGTPSRSKTISVFYHSNRKKKLKIDPIQEGIIMGVTAAIILKGKIPMLSLFAETHSQMPDSESAANVIKVLDDYLKLKVDYKPLLKQAKEFEAKLKEFIAKSQPHAAKMTPKEKKELSYFG